MALYIGDFEITQMYLGDIDPSAAYVGDTLFYPSSVVITGISITSSISSEATGGTFSIRVKSESDWVLSVSDSSWITVSPDSGTSGSNLVTVTISDNNSGADRTGSITASTTDSLYSAVCSVSQAYEIDYSTHYFTTRSLVDNNTITFRMPTGVSTTRISQIAYSTDNGNTWTTVQNINSTNITASVVLNNGDEAIWKGIGISTSGPGEDVNRNASSFNATGNFEVEGNIFSLLEDSGFTGSTHSTSTHIFTALFRGRTTIINAENLVFPSSSVSNDGYSHMFQSCSKLITAPKILPAMTLDANCYHSMFSDCSNILKAPILPATSGIGAYSCYYYMFTNCSKLNYIECMATRYIGDFSWVGGVDSSGTFVKNPSTSWPYGTGSVPNGWTIVDYTG